MLHYYFRTKENLFNCIFERIATQIVDLFNIAFEGDAPFFEKLKEAVELHFDCLVERSNLPMFVFREIIRKEERKAYFLKQIFPAAKRVLAKMHSDIKREVKNGKIRPVSAQNLLLNIASLNVFTFIGVNILFNMNDEKATDAVKKFLADRKQSNVNTIINSLKL
jgi:AcrR family transcriptional regulator